MYNLASSIVPTIINEFSTDCIFGFLNIEEKTAYYIDYLLGLSGLILFMLLLIFIFAIRRLRTRNDPNPFPFIEMTQSTFLIIFYLKQPEILIETLKLFNCREIGGNTLVLVDDLSIECGDSFFYQWSYGVGIPILAIVGFIFPLWLFAKIRNKFKDKSDLEKWYRNYSQYSFILGGYQDEYYYWEFLIILRKILMVFIVIMMQNAT
mmetsp:Transcript_16342/g.14040  ORF Transcript_16342/g.14040 Transcript_16342/m.14040 type:complete len:207 (+) Transcript_16342:1738-2358(+)